MEDIVNLNMLEQIRLQLQKIDTDIVINGDLLMEKLKRQRQFFQDMIIQGDLICYAGLN